MARYLARPFPAKKLERLERLERNLLKEIGTYTESDLIFLAAEKVREAQITYLEAKRHYVVDDGNPDFSGFKKIDLALAEWRIKTAKETVDHYRRRRRTTRESS